MNQLPRREWEGTLQVVQVLGVDGCCLPTHPKRLTDFIGSPCETLRAMGVTEIQLHKEFGSETPFSIVTISRHTLVAGKKTKNSRAAVTIS
ncbi:hypothetical protein BGX38DRAFT_1277827 [Terfezia claveryi]|nr:hypothetical protein BGX38DRAFT_1277827 [Terfezia claveryi]